MDNLATEIHPRQKKTSFFYQRKGKRALTLALRYDEQGNLYIGHAVCSPRDMFCKKIGRKIADGRISSLLAKGKLPYFVDVCNRAESVYDDIEDFIKKSVEHYPIFRFFVYE